MGFGQGLSGLNAASQNLDVIGNNIANSKTVGFKASSIAFADVYANSRVGLGVQVASVDQRFTNGNVSVTGNEFDMAIDGDMGLFRLVDNSGAVYYSRNGQFHADKDFRIVNNQGQQLTGFAVNDDGKITNQTVPISVPVGNMAPQATDDITVKANLDSRSAAIEPPPNDLAEAKHPDNHNYSLPITVFDSLGNPHQLTQYFVKTASTGNESEWKVYLDAGDNTTVSNSPVSLRFDEAGRLVNDAPLQITINGLSTDGSPAADIDATLNYKGTTQFGGDFNAKFTQNGYTTGDYTSMSIAADGTIVANYTNGETKVMGAVALADFNNLNGLRPVGGNAWVETAESGQAVLGQPGKGGFATLKGQSVEDSNVDMSEELVNMIIAQRTYQANAQTIKTEDQILQTLITLR